MLKTNITIVALLVFSCGVPQKDYEKVLKENDSLSAKIKVLTYEQSMLTEQNERLWHENEKYKREKEEEELIQKRKKYISESEALRYVRDYYEFYETDKVFRNAKVRRVDANRFNVSLEECSKRNMDDDFFWNAMVKELVVNNDGTYNLKRNRFVQ